LRILETPTPRGIWRWKLVKGLVRRSGSSREKDEAALRLAAPESGSFVLSPFAGADANDEMTALRPASCVVSCCPDRYT